MFNIKAKTPGQAKAKVLERLSRKTLLSMLDKHNSYVDKVW